MLRELGAGGVGAVYLCAPLAGGEPKAVKLIVPPHERLADRLRDRAIREAETLARLDHPGIVRVSQWGTDERRNLVYLVMDLVEGAELDPIHVRRDGKVDNAALRLLFDRLLDALEYAHAKGCAHRDLKRSNVLVRASDGYPVLVDWGSLYVGGDERLTRFEDSHALGRTDHYAPPEALMNPAGADPYQWDLYSLGVMLHTLLAGVDLPYEDEDDRHELLVRKASESLDPGEGVDAGLRDLVRRATHPLPDKRPKTIAAFRRALHGQGRLTAIPSLASRANTAIPLDRSDPTTPLPSDFDELPAPRAHPTVVAGADADDEDDIDPAAWATLAEHGGVPAEPPALDTGSSRTGAVTAASGPKSRPKGAPEVGGAPAFAPPPPPPRAVAAPAPGTSSVHDDEPLYTPRRGVPWLLPALGGAVLMGVVGLGIMSGLVSGEPEAEPVATLEAAVVPAPPEPVVEEPQAEPEAEPAVAEVTREPVRRAPVVAPAVETRPIARPEPEPEPEPEEPAVAVVEPPPPPPTPPPASSAPPETERLKALLAAPPGKLLSTVSKDPAAVKRAVTDMATKAPDAESQQVAKDAYKRLTSEMRRDLGSAVAFVRSARDGGALDTFLAIPKQGQGAALPGQVLDVVAESAPGNVQSPASPADCKRLVLYMDHLGRSDMAEKHPWILDACKACRKLGGPVGHCEGLDGF